MITLMTNLESKTASNSLTVSTIATVSSIDIDFLSYVVMRIAWSIPRHSSSVNKQYVNRELCTPQCHFLMLTINLWSASYRRVVRKSQKTYKVIHGSDSKTYALDLNSFRNSVNIKVPGN